MSMRKNPQQTYIHGEHIGLLDDVVGRSGRYLEIEASQLDSKRHIGRRLVSKIKPNGRLDRLVCPKDAGAFAGQGPCSSSTPRTNRRPSETALCPVASPVVVPRASPRSRAIPCR